MVVTAKEEVDPGAAGAKGFGQNVQRLSSYFYTEDGILVSTRVARLQQAFDNLMKFSTAWTSAPIFTRRQACLVRLVARLGTTLGRHTASR